ncbi:DUF3592 domain-containing protein [Arthrobacter agilis]|uniref:DUF3592 domain-containing protein n=1 Tax=Arthrobacter agilis TaxID=37921 RepID=UPI00277F72BA|nr:DUF3592 domain-containing protein [Arthrobacter agilis]MDQ0736201.1 hypothetical protein [Arthrobacter agilis]
MPAAASEGTRAAVVIEFVTAALTALGLGLLIAALVIRLVYGSWTRTQAVTFDHEGHPYLRWHDHRYRIVEALWASGLRRRKGAGPPPLPAGEDVTVFYQARNPAQWSLEQPYRGTRALAVVGLVCAVLGTLLGFLPG